MSGERSALKNVETECAKEKPICIAHNNAKPSCEEQQRECQNTIVAEPILRQYISD